VRAEEQLRTYRKLVNKAALVPDHDRSLHIAQSLSAMVKVMTNDTSLQCRGEVQNAVELVWHWASDFPLDDRVRRSYGLFSHLAMAYSRRLGGEEVALRRYEHATSESGVQY
jgi:hypothetical protein